MKKLHFILDPHSLLPENQCLEKQNPWYFRGIFADMVGRRNIAKDTKCLGNSWSTWIAIWNIQKFMEAQSVYPFTYYRTHNGYH